VSKAAFGAFYDAGEIIARQGEIAEGLYVVQDGTVEVVVAHGATEVVLWTAAVTRSSARWPSSAEASDQPACARRVDREC
jgi:hypothetical protein